VDGIYEFGIEQMPLAQSIEARSVAIRTAADDDLQVPRRYRAVSRQARAQAIASRSTMRR
jgi:hypothetical protein